MKDHFPDTYDQLTAAPLFIAFVLVKIPPGGVGSGQACS